MNLQITVTNKEEALEAITLLQAYTRSNVGVKAVETKEEVVEKPKKTATKKIETKKVEEPVEDEVESDEEPEVETQSSITLKDLTAIAKAAVDRTDRTEAKDVISKYGAKLSEVEESDYSALAKELEALGA